MPVKDDWANGQTVNATDLNDIGGAINTLEENSSAAWDDITGKPAVIAAGATQADARTAIGAVAAADITAAVNAVLDGAPGALDTLNELAAALGDDANFAATVTTALAAKAARPGNIYYTNDYGLVGNWSGGDATAGSGTNDTAALNTLIATAPAGSTIVFDGAKTYRLDPLTTITKALTLDFNGASVVTKTMATGVFTAGSPLIRFSAVGALGTARAFGAVALWDKSLTTTTAAHAGDFAAGDYVFVSDNFELVNWQDGSHQGAGRGEINIVESANSGTGVVALETPMSANFSSTYNSTTPTIQKMTPIVGAVVKNIEQVIDTNPGGDFTGSFGAVGTRPNIIEFDYCVDPVIENVTVNGWVLSAASFARCMRPLAVNLHGNSPFSVNSGHGYLIGMYQCSDGLALRCTSYSCRHTVDYESGTRCGSKECRAYNVKGRAYGPHGHESRDMFSIDDWVIGGDTNSYGWGNGNTSFAADHGYRIIRPNMYGGDRGIIANGGSDGLRVISPNLHTPSHCIKLEYALDTVIDLRSGGVLHNTNSVTTTGRTIWAETGVGNTALDTGDVTVYGTKEGFQGTYKAIKLTLQPTATAKLIDIPTTITPDIVAGIADYGKALGAGVSMTQPKIDEILDTNGNIILTLGPTVSAVNRLAIINNIAGSAPFIQAQGSDTNISFDARAKGTGLFGIQDGATSSKRVRFNVAGVTGTRNWAFPDAASTFVGTDVTQTLTSKRVNPRIGTTASSATPTADADSHDQYNVTALAAGATFGAPTGTPVDGQKLLYRVKDNGTARSLAFNAIFRALGITLPTTTVLSKTLYIGTVYNSADAKWDVLAVGQEA